MFKRFFAKLFRTLGAFALAVALACVSSPQASPLLNGVNISSYIRDGGEENNPVLEKLRGYYGREITARLLQQILDEVDQGYREMGYDSVKAYFPEQVSSDGVINISVAAPYLERTDFDNVSGVNIQTRRLLTEEFEDLEGYAVHTEEIRGRLLRLADLDVFNVSAGFSRGSRDAASVLKVKMTRKEKYPFRLFADNHGTRAAGQWRFGAAAKVRNLSHHADVLSLAAARSNRKQNDGMVSYSIPVSSHPTVIGAALSAGSYELGEEYEALGAKGYAFTGDLFLEEPWLRGGDHGLKSRFTLRHRVMRDKFDVFDVTFKKSSTALSGDLALWQRQGNWLFEGTGRLTMGSVSNQDDYEISPEGSFRLLNLEGAVTYRFSDTLRARGNLEAQLSSDRLESSLRFQAGGASRVSAFKSSEACGDNGLFLRGSLEFSPRENFTLAPHLDFARVSNHGGSSLSVKGMGLQASANFKGFFVSADISKSLGSVKSADDSQFLISFGYGRA